MPLTVFEQIAVVHLSARTKLGEMRKETVWYGCLKYKEAGLGDLRQTSLIYYKAIRGLHPIMSWCRGLTPVSNSAPRSRFPLPPPSGVRRKKEGKKK